jgi:23S rRNA pseudoU1915 N3-methylase RlmH
MNDTVKSNLDAAYASIPEGKKLVLVCVRGHGLAKQAMAYYQSAGVDMSKITYLIGGAEGGGVSDATKADAAKWEVSN